VVRSSGADAGRGAPRDPQVSVVTVSFGRVDLVRRKLEALARQTTGAAAFEVVLVDNACPDRVGERMAAEAWPFALRVLRSERRLNAADGRAWAAREARGRWLWWSDDDVVPADDALAVHLAVQARRPGVTIGSVRFVGEHGSHAWRPRRAGPVQVTGVNTLLPRDAVLSVAPRLPRLPRAYGGEDALVGLALRADGVAFADAPGAWVDHLGPLPAREAGAAAPAFDAGYNAAVIARLYPSAAWALGTHALSLGLKRVVLARAWRGVWSVLAPRRWAFERAYLDGALAARRDRGDASPVTEDEA